MSYRELKSYQTATTVYDFTVEFCDRYIEAKTYKRDRTYRRSRLGEQMEQAARSGKQNIVEGSSERASKKSELKLIGVARASFQELLEDFEDFLRQRNLRQWEKNSPEDQAVRALAYKKDKTYQNYRAYLSHPEAAANCAICLINQVNYLLDRQIKSLEEKFVKQGGWTEQMRRKRWEEKKRQFGWRFGKWEK